jgi:hypothetical protein
MSRSQANRPLWKRKKPHRGKACRRGEPVYYEEKKRAINLMLTPRAISVLTEIAQEIGQSRSEVIELALRFPPIQQTLRLELIKANTAKKDES